MNTPQVTFEEIVNGSIIGDYQKGIYCVEGRTQFGPLNRPDILVTSPQAFEKYYGGELLNEDFPTLCKRALNNGCALRINGIKNGGVLSSKNHTIQFVLSGNIVSGQRVKFDPLGGSSYAVVQPFLSSSINTLTALVNQIKSKYPKEYVKDAKVIDARTITVTPGSNAYNYFLVNVLGPTPPTTTKSNITNGADSNGNILFSLDPKYVGDYNDLVVEINKGSNGKANSFDIIAYVSNLKNTTYEIYKNLSITTLDIANTQHYLDDIINNSSLLDVTYQDLSALNTIPIPIFNTFSYSQGSIGNDLNDNDYIGDAGSKTGVYAFDRISNASILSILITPTTTVGNAFDSYVRARKDMVQIIHLDNSITDANNLVNARNAYSVDDSYTFFWAGGLLINDTLTPNAKREISEMGDVLAAAAYNDINFGPWYSFSGKNRGRVNGALKVINDFGADFGSLELLAANQINIVKKSGNLIHLWHSFTGQSNENALSFINVRRMLIDLEQSLKPILESYIEEPNDIQTWKRIFLEVDPFLRSREEAQAFYYTKKGLGWFGDQFATDLNSLSINNLSDVRAGKYKVNLLIIEIASLQQIKLSVNLSPAGISITDNFNNNQ